MRRLRLWREKMPIRSFTGKTYVSFSDLNGFKELMHNQKEAANALDKFYKSVYKLKGQIKYSDLRTIAISDCAITFIAVEGKDNLPLLLDFLKDLHIMMIESEYLITTTIAYGQFSYQQRIEITGLGKDMLYGDAYLKAYLNNNKAPEGSIVIVCEQAEKDDILQASQRYKHLIKDIQKRISGLRFYWPVKSPDEILSFEEEYHNTYNLKYKGMISVYQKYTKQLANE